MVEGNSLVQYGHQVAQKYRSTTWPLNWASETFVPSSPGSSNAGAVCPASGAGWRAIISSLRRSAAAPVAAKTPAMSASALRAVREVLSVLMLLQYSHSWPWIELHALRALQVLRDHVEGLWSG